MVPLGCSKANKSSSAYKSMLGTSLQSLKEISFKITNYDVRFAVLVVWSDVKRKFLEKNH